MYLLFADETNTSPKHDARVKFFVYGGLIVPSKQMLALDKLISSLRKKYGYKPTDSLKFDSNSRPKNVTTAEFAAIKNEIVDACIEHDCKLLLYVVLHDIARKQGLPTTIKWGADHIFQKFSDSLTANGDLGFAFIDRMSNTGEYSLLCEKFTQGLIYKHANKTVPLKNIRLYASVCDNSSNFSSIADIVLGTFRYCINQPYNEPAAKKMMKNLTKLIWARREGKNLYVFEKGLTYRPVQSKVKIPQYKKEYEDLLTHMNSLLKE